jgi:signal transduction histidine kinase
MRSLGAALAFAASGAAVLAALELALLCSAGAYIATLFPVIGLVYSATGLVAWWRRPSNRLGPIMAGGSLAWFIAGLSNTGIQVLIATGLVVVTVPLAIVVHLLLAFPSGRLRTRGALLTVLAGYAVALVLQAPLYLFAPQASPGGTFAVANVPALATSGEWLQRAAGIMVMAATMVILARRLRQAQRARRRVLAPLYLYGIGAVVFLPLAPDLIEPLTGISATTVGVAQLTVMAGIPIAFALAMLCGGFARMSELEELGTWLGSAAETQEPLERALALSLGDQSVELAFWAADRDTYLDAAGREISLPRPGTGRGTVGIELGDRQIGAIVYDKMLIDDEELVRAAGRTVAIAVDRLRLTVDLLASQEMLRLSLGRLVEAQDRERRRIARDLHDGLQAKLILLALEAQRLAGLPGATPAVADAATRLRSRIDAAAADLRELVHDVMPALLVERGLAAAVEELAGQMPLPVRLEIDVGEQLGALVSSTAYFVVAEGLANAVKHSRATKLAIRLAREASRLIVEVADDGAGGVAEGTGLGLRSIADRVGALGGSLRVHSPDGQGTTVVAELPCGS